MSYRIDLSSASAAISSIGMDEINGTHAETLNDIDYLDFTLYINSSEWSDCSPNLTYIDLYSSIADGYLFNGRVISSTDDLAEEGLVSKQIHCESEIAYLCDSVCDVQDVLTQMEQSFHSTEYTPGDPIIADLFIRCMLELHAMTVDVKRRIYPPNYTWNSGGYFEKIDPLRSSGYPASTIDDSLNIDTGSTFSVLKSLRDKLGYDIWCEHTDGKAYLKVGLAGSRESGTSGFNIVLSKNMRSLTVERAPVNEGRVTRICPLGGVGADGKRLNISSVNDDMTRYLANDDLVAIYGNIDMVVLYDDLVDDGNLTAAQLTAVKNELKSRGQDRLNLLTGGITGIRCRAVDLYELGMRLDADHAAYPFKVGGLYGFDCSIFGITDATQFRLFSKTTNLEAPYDPELTFVLPSATYKPQVTNERLRIQQKFYAQAKAQADRLDNKSIKKTTSSSYDSSTANDGTIYYVDKGDGTGEIMLDGTSYGGGGGSTTTVGNAAVMSTDFSDFNVTEQLMLDITPNTTLYYGASPSFMVIQGHYCLLCSTSNIVQYSNGVWTIGQTAGLYERIIANKAKFGSQIGSASGGGWLSGYSTGVAYPSRYIYETLEIYQISTTTAGNTYTAYLRMYWANANAPSGNWWESTMSWGSFTKVQYQVSLKAANNTNYMTTLNDVFIVPVLSQYTNDATVGTLKTPYGYANIAGYLIFSSADGTHYGVVWYPVTSGDASITRAPCVSEAEQCFALGISRRTEPVTGGGT